MAEEEGFEPPRGLTRLSVFKTDPFSRTWVFLRMMSYRQKLIYHEFNRKSILFEKIIFLPYELHSMLFSLGS